MLYHEETLNGLSNYLNKSVEDILLEFENYIMFVIDLSKPHKGRIFKNHKDCKFEVADRVFVEDYSLYGNENIFGFAFPGEARRLWDMEKDEPKYVEKVTPKKKVAPKQSNMPIEDSFVKMVQVLAKLYKLNPRLTLTSVKAMNKKIVVNSKIRKTYPNRTSKEEIRYIYEAIESFDKNLMNLDYNGNLDRVCESFKLVRRDLHGILHARQATEKLKL